jgi:hypothetical protein
MAHEREGQEATKVSCEYFGHMLWDADKRAHQAWNYIRLLDTVRDGFQVLLMSLSKTSISESIRVCSKNSLVNFLVRIGIGILFLPA